MPRIREADGPPPKDAPKDAPPTVEKSRPPSLKKLHRQLTELYQTVAITVLTPLDQLAGMLTYERAESLADTWIDLAEREPKVKRAIERLLEGSAWTGVLVAHGAIIIPVLANRGFFPDNVAHGAAAMTLIQNPNMREYFTHPRWAEAQGAMTSQNGNGDGGSVG